jgi:MYXO-CTERM domain-containing protein
MTNQMKNARSEPLALAAAATLALFAFGTLATPGVAMACGGLFCDGPPTNPLQPLPVAQNGENVVFSMTRDPAGGASHLIAHIQILYTGDAAQFSWVVPVDAVPKVEVGTDQLFIALARVTQPRFNAAYATEGTCIPDSKNGGFEAPTPGQSGTGGRTGSADAGVISGGSVMVLSQGAVGPFDTAVVKSDDPMALKDWLTKNGYVVSDQASAIIDAYVREAKYFVALKLLNGKDTSAIQPVVLKFDANEACVPLRLTAIAANPDMPVRIWVLADHRAVPVKNFLELKLDEARIDWSNGGMNYNALLGEAADDAGRNAFVAEYAGPSTIASGLLWSPGQFDEAALRAAATPPVFVQLLVSMGLGGDAQTLPLLRKYIPMPAAIQEMGISDAQFYGNLSLYWAQYAITPDLPGLADQVMKVIIEPRRLAQLMIDAQPYLTRLNTFISPEEMTADALFDINPDFPDVSNVHTATFRTMCGNMRYTACNAPIRLELPDGRMTWVRSAGNQINCTYRPIQLAGLTSLPAAEMVWQRETTGAGVTVKDNTADIRHKLELNDEALGMRGCSCAMAGPAAPGLAGATLALAGLALALRRRRGRKRSRPVSPRGP